MSFSRASNSARSVPAKWLLLIVSTFTVAFFLFAEQGTRARYRASAETTAPAAIHLGAVERPQTAANYGKLPLTFVRNLGQLDGRVKFTARGSNYAFYLTANEAVFALRREASDA